jgi:RimJ/RimL family protein N-acetyltransferase
VIRLVDVYDPTGPGGIRAGALEWLYELIQEREPEVNISHRDMPTFEQHRQFVTRRPYRFWYLIEYSPDTPELVIAGYVAPIFAGYVSATHDNEIGIVLRGEFRGHGLGPDAVRMLIEKHRPNPAEPSVRNGNWLANVAPANERSRRMFEGLGFRKIQETFEFQKSTEEESHGNAQGTKAG